MSAPLALTFLAGMTLASGSLSGCASSDDPGELLGVDCGGKCDGFDDIRALLRDPFDIDLDDLVRIGAPYATEAINDALTLGDYAQFKLGETKSFGSGELNSLTSGLAARFGETELSTIVNKARERHLSSSADTVFAESTFALRSDLAAKFNIETGDEEGSIRLGFGGSEIAVHMVGAYKDDIDAIKDAPLATIKETGRGFVLPRDVSDIRKMKPGESIGMHAEGTLGINLGVGVPLLIADPGAITYKFVLSAGLRSQLEGDLDVQLVRLEGDEVVIDVGIERARIKSTKLALRDSWGVQGLLESEVSVAGFDVDLGRLVDKALQKQLNRHLNFVEARRESTNRKMRMSVARLRFDLSHSQNPEVDAAIAQALRGDVRLAQALSNRNEPGVIAEFDLSRSGTSVASYAGIEIAGMEFFRNEIETSGSVVVQTPGGARSILFDSLHRSSGWFLARHGYTRVALSSVDFDGFGGANAAGEANLIVQLDEGDRAMERDKFVDYLDSIIVSIAGQGALEALETSGNQLEELVETTCAGTGVFDDCPIDVLTAPQAIALRDRAAADFANASGHVSGDLGALVREAAALRVLAQSVYEQKAQFTGPGTSLTADFRLDNNALAALMAQGAGERIKQAARNVVLATEIDRRKPVAGQRSSMASDLDGKLEKLAVSAENISRQYRQLAAVETAAIESLGPIGGQALEIRFDIDSNNRVNYESAAANTIAAKRATLAADLFDQLRRDSKDLPIDHAEQIAGFALLGAISADQTDIRLDIDLSTKDTALFWREPYRRAGYPETADGHARGAAVDSIDGGMFSVDQLIEVK